MQHDFIMRSKMSVIKSKMGTIKSKIDRKFEQKRKAKWVKEKAYLVKAYNHRTLQSIQLIRVAFSKNSTLQPADYTGPVFYLNNLSNLQAWQFDLSICQGSSRGK